MNWYLTLDTIGIETGGGAVTFHESEAFKTLGPCQILSRENLSTTGEDPWGWDDCLHAKVPEGIKLVHAYAGSFPRTAKCLKEIGAKLVWTVAAHDKLESWQEHKNLGLQFNYCHLTEEPLWQRYISGYLASDVIVCPSTVAETVRKYPYNGRIEVIEHGCTLPDSYAHLPTSFICGYLGVCGGPDKGLIYLLQAWKKLGYKDAKLVLAGSDSMSPWVQHLVKEYGGGIIYLAGRYNKVADFYNSISLLIQPSVTEGFACTVLEAMSHGRPVICSTGAGASDIVPKEYCFTPRDVDTLAFKINTVRSILENKREISGISGSSEWQKLWRIKAESYSWPKIRQRYISLWQEMLGDQRVAA